MKLIFMNCNAIRNWHLVTLGQVCDSLALHQCWNISGVGMLGQVRELKVEGCPLVKAIEGLGGCRQAWVSLADLPITSARPVRLVPHVTIVRCKQLRGLEGFGEEPGQTLTLEDLSIKSFSELKGRALGNVHVTSCDEIKSAEGLEDCDAVSLNHMRNLHDVSNLCNVRHLRVLNCHRLKDTRRDATP